MGDPRIQGEAAGGQEAEGGRSCARPLLWFLWEHAGKAGAGARLAGSLGLWGIKTRPSHVEPGPGMIRAGG